MKKKIFLFMLMGVLALSLTGCVEIKKVKESDVVLSIKDSTLSPKGATFILKNNTEKEYLYGPEYYIEIKDNENWKEIELDDPLSWISIVYTLEAKEEKEINIDWSYGYGELSKGQYRLVKKAFMKESKPTDDSDIVYLYSEFEIK